ncbi:MAG: hypothetical protein EBU49_00105 [Proteobacteria bacterium]|nr:hypothetical protein [Pseudomonadota bacterium]
MLSRGWTVQEWVVALLLSGISPEHVMNLIVLRKKWAGIDFPLDGMRVTNRLLFMRYLYRTGGITD